MYRGIKMILKKFRELLLEDIYHKGALYCTFNSNDNPNGRLPGTWERLPNGVFIRNAGGNAGTVGQVQNEGLPNIKGYIDPQARGDQGHASGAFQGRIVSGWYPQGSSNTHMVFDFNASDGEVKANGTYKNDAYGKSDHVTPINVALYMWRRTA